MARKKNNTNQKNEPLKPPDITDPLFPYGPKNKHLQGVLGIRKDAKHRKDIIQTPVTLEEDKYLEEIYEALEEVVSATLILEQSSEDGKIEAGSRYDSPLGIAILGAPASGKSYLTKKIATSLKDPRIARAQQAGKKYEIDYMRNQFRSQRLDQPLNINLGNFLPSYYNEESPAAAPLNTPTPNASILTPPIQQFAGLQNGLTPTENVLLSPGEKQMRLKQRGLA